MSQEFKSQFVYVIYIRTTPEALWAALTTPETMRTYWFGMHIDSDWTPGAPWRMLFEDGRVADAGRVLEADPPRRLVLDWQNQFRDELKAEGVARCTYALEPKDDVVKLTITHQSPVAGSRLIEAVSGGWPSILSNLKSLLETGAAFARPN